MTGHFSLELFPVCMIWKPQGGIFVESEIHLLGLLCILPLVKRIEELDAK